jgi:GNAT superfamily N-acetyltransferase
MAGGTAIPGCPLLSAPRVAVAQWVRLVQPERSDMRFKVRRAVIGDEPVLRALRLQALTDSPRAFSSTYERELARTAEDWRRWLAGGVTFLLEADGEPRGLVAGSRDAQGFSAVHLMAMWVHPDLRGTGAAHALVSSLKAWAVEVGATQILLKVVESNSIARRFYERAGFRATGHKGVGEESRDIEIEMTCDVFPCDQ